MSDKVMISLKVDKKDKERATQIFNSLGLNLTTAINIFLKKSIHDGGMPFDVKDPFYSEANMKVLRERAEAVDNGTADMQRHDIIEN